MRDQLDFDVRSIVVLGVDKQSQTIALVLNSMAKVTQLPTEIFATLVVGLREWRTLSDETFLYEFLTVP